MSDEYTYPPLKRKTKTRQSWDSRRIRALREFMGLTQREMADELEVRQQTISEWETGLHTPHRSTQKTLSMVAERVGFAYESGERPAEEITSNDQQRDTGQATRNRVY
ncbi:helix-turn-helix transcriptional regulator [Candidatus Gracilibacteria bacterium]|nr:helix-turn-helix transcriptional regulator [Candidatus Gracilibacteria bacterium]